MRVVIWIRGDAAAFVALRCSFGGSVRGECAMIGAGISWGTVGARRRLGGYLR